jgi:hypothetical protein
MGREAILFRAHGFSAGAALELRRLTEQAGGDRDVWLVGFCEDADALERYEHERTVAFDAASLSALPYPSKIRGGDWNRMFGNNDLPVMRFFLDRPGYERVWVVEYDVRFTGRWDSLLADLSSSPADLLGTTVQTYADNPNWCNWASLTDRVDRRHWIKGFLPFARVSHKALAAIDAGYRLGWAGHSEAVWPTLTGLAGLAIEDVGGCGRFVPAGRKDRYYHNNPLDPHLRPGSFVFRPTSVAGCDDQSWRGDDADARSWAAEAMSAPDRLVHPVKD